MEDIKSEHTIIAAAPGWCVAFYGNHDSKESIVLEPVIGWTITRNAVVRPRRTYINHEIEPLLVGSSVHESEVPWALKRPDGMFQLIENSSTATEQETLDWLRKETRRMGGPTPLVK